MAGWRFLIVGVLQMKKLLIKCINVTFIFFVLMVIYQFIIKDEVKWLECLLVSFVFGIVNFIWDWVNIPYNLNKKIDKKA